MCCWGCSDECVCVVCCCFAERWRAEVPNTIHAVSFLEASQLIVAAINTVDQGFLVIIYF